MPDIEIKRGYGVLPNKNVRFGIKITNTSDLTVSDVELLLDYPDSLFNLQGESRQKLGSIPPSNTRTAEFILKPLGCIHEVNIEALISYRDAKYEKKRIDMRPKEVHCVSPFLKPMKIQRVEFLKLSKTGHTAEAGLNFKGVPIGQLTSYLTHTCGTRHFPVDNFPIDSGRMLYLASESISEKAYYLLTALIKETEGLTQVMLRAVSDNPYGLNGFLDEIVTDLRHVINTVQSAQEIGVIKKEQVINFFDSVVQRPNFESGGPTEVNFHGSIVQRPQFGSKEEPKKQRQEETERKKREEEEHNHREKEERLQKEKEEQERKAREEAERLRKEKEKQKRKAQLRKEAERNKREEEERRLKDEKESKQIHTEQKGHPIGKFMAFIVVLGVLVVGYSMMESDSDSKTQKTITNSIDTEFKYSDPNLGVIITNISQSPEIIAGERFYIQFSIINLGNETIDEEVIEINMKAKELEDFWADLILTNKETSKIFEIEMNSKIEPNSSRAGIIYLSTQQEINGLSLAGTYEYIFTLYVNGQRSYSKRQSLVLLKGNPRQDLEYPISLPEPRPTFSPGTNFSSGILLPPSYETTTNFTGMEFVLIPAGEFEMGSPSVEIGRDPNEGPVHTVTIEKAYYLGKYEVTQKQWGEVMGFNPSKFKGDDLPVEYVSWADAQEFVRKVNQMEGTDKYRLPSEAEWEYAARAGTTTRYSFGDDESDLGYYAWWDRNPGDKTHPVGQKQPNAWGLYDIHGNVWEWVQDRWHSDYDGAPTDGSAWESGSSTIRVIRGGYWDYSASCRSAYRGNHYPDRRSYLGFRLLKEL